MRFRGPVVGHIALFLGCFVLTCGLVSRGLGEPDDSLTAHKLQAWLREKDEFDTLFLGTSVIYHQIDPAVFDRRMDELGRPTRSFNLGVEAMSGPEMLQTLDRVLAARPANLRHVVFSAWGDLRIAEANLATDRVTAWHTWRGTWRAIRLSFDADRSLHSRRNRVVGHLRALANRVGNAGRWQRPLARVVTRTAAARERRLRMQRRIRDVELGAAGFMPLADRLGIASPSQLRAIEAERAELVSDLYDQRLRELTEAALDPAPPTTSEDRLLGELIRRCRQAGVTPSFLVGPSLVPDQLFLRVAAEQGRIQYLLDFEDPERFPAHYQVGQRFDVGHLNAVGARDFSRQVAEFFHETVPGADGG